jgi:hypothetical protein
MQSFERHYIITTSIVSLIIMMDQHVHASGIFHGNYCGPFHGDDSYMKPPVDHMDALCRQHDLCYDKNKYSDCACDFLFVNEIEEMMELNILDDISVLIYATVASSLMQNTPCTCYDKNSNSKYISSPQLEDKSRCIPLSNTTRMN